MAPDACMLAAPLVVMPDEPDPEPELDPEPAPDEPVPTGPTAPVPDGAGDRGAVPLVMGKGGITPPEPGAEPVPVAREGAVAVG